MSNRKWSRRPLVLGLALAAAWALAPVPSAAGDKPALALGAKVPNTGSLRDLRGSGRPLHSFSGHRALVLAFVGTECPISNLYLPGLIELEKKHRGKQVQFLAVYPNEQEDLDRVAAHAYDRDVPFPALRDARQKLADALGVKRLPTVVVLDKDFVLRYRGRVDDRYGVAFRRQKATRDDLAQALEEMLAGKKVSVAETEADGCLVGRPGKGTARQGVTYSKEVARILQKNCQSCHRPGEAAPFSLLTYEDAVRHARMLKEVTGQRRMPPWHADPRYGKFANNRRLSAEDIETLAAWVDAGTPRGDVKDLPKPITWSDGWKLGKPDLVLSMPKEFAVPAEGSLPYQYYVIDPGFEEDRWVQLAEARPGAPSVVHHIVVYILKPGQERIFTPDGGISILVGWAPGDLGLVCPPDTALRIPKGAKLRFELHYTPNGKAVKDRSRIGITFAKKPPRSELLMNSFANESISLPPGDPHYKAEMTLRFRADARVLSFTPHMHWRGKDYRYEVIYPDGRRETVLSVPRWDFNWQNVYWFREPLKLPRGSKIYSVAHWDNSRNNPYNPDPTKRVRFGLQTWEEMMVGWVAYVWERPGTAEELAKKPLSLPDQLFERFDRNGDDVITRDEIPEQMLPLIEMAGVKLPSRIDRAQFRRLFEEAMRRRFERPPPGKGPKDGGKEPPAKGEKAK
jgi:mono/diheme cytochrome c family protein